MIKHFKIFESNRNVNYYDYGNYIDDKRRLELMYSDFKCMMSLGYDPIIYKNKYRSRRDRIDRFFISYNGPCIQTGFVFTCDLKNIEKQLEIDTELQKEFELKYQMEKFNV